MASYTAINKKWWNNVTPIHAASKLYDLESFKKGKTSLQSTEIAEVGDVSGKTLLHLLCHFGLDTLSWVRKGAIATGVDISDTSIDLANQISKEMKIPAEFICSDVYDLPKVLDKKFDIIFLSYGVLLWLSSIERWAEIVNSFLKKGGMLYIIEIHPFTNMLSSDMKLSYHYFDTDPFVDDSAGTYADWKAKIEGKTYVWFHSLGEVYNALVRVGLTVEYMHEFPYTMYNQFPGHMTKNSKGQYILKENEVGIPLLFSLKATK